MLGRVASLELRAKDLEESTPILPHRAQDLKEGRCSREVASGFPGVGHIAPKAQLPTERLLCPPPAERSEYFTAQLLEIHPTI